ncbi:divalent metal cation transporter, partial [Rhizobium johnstonii]|uniref:divalent metal cation transporter n=1 Tax=Rhizobium johnstonii TaxID=3019933 RepID=UPI003F977E4E
PLLLGGVITGVISIVLLLVQSRRGPRTFEFVIIGLLLVIVKGFTVGVFIAPPDAAGVISGLVPRFEGSTSVLLAASILGATIMPHAIYAHSALARDRWAGRTDRTALSVLIDAPDVTASEPSPHARPLFSTRRLLRATRWDVS